MSGKASMDNIGNEAWKGIGWCIAGVGLGATSYLSGFSGASVAVAVLGAGAEALGFYTLGSKVITPGVEKVRNYANGWVEWGKNIQDYRFGPTEMAAFGATTAGLTGVFLSNSWLGTITSAIAAGGGAYAGVNYGETARLGQQIATPSGPIVTVPLGANPLQITTNSILHLDYPLSIRAPSDPNIIFNSVGSAMVGWMYNDSYVNSHASEFVEKGGSELREKFLNENPNNLLAEYRSNSPTLDSSKRALLRDLLNTKFGIGVSAQNRTPAQERAREALMATNNQFEHPDLPDDFMSGAEVTNMLKECWRQVEAENKPKVVARGRPAVVGGGVPPTVNPVVANPYNPLYPQNYGARGTTY